MNLKKKAISLLICLSFSATLMSTSALASIIDNDNFNSKDTQEKFPVTETTFGAGAIINGYYTYCVDKNSPWPKIGTEYYKAELPENIADKKDLLARALEGGYPIDAYGISKTSGTLPPLSMGGATQFVIWDIIGGDLKKTGIKQDFYIYMDTLIDFVINDNLKRLSSSQIKIETYDMEYDKIENCTTGTLKFSGNRSVTLSYNLQDSNITILDGITELKNGSKISSNKELKFKIFGAQPVNLKFSYDDYDIVDPESLVLYKTDDSSNGITYQRMLGFKTTPVQGFALSTIKPIITDSDNDSTLKPDDNFPIFNDDVPKNSSENEQQNNITDKKVESIENYPIPLTNDENNNKTLLLLLMILGCSIAILKLNKSF